MKAGQLVYIFFLIHLCIPSSAQEKLLFHHLDLEDGLSEATNPFIYKDSKGFIWISSVNGLNRFDGTRIRQYTPDATINGSINGENIQSSFFESTDGFMWFCSYVSINAYDPKQDTFSHYKINREGTALTGYYAFYLDSSDNLWTIAEETNIYKFNTRTKKISFVTSLKFEAARAIMIESSPGVPHAFYTYTPSQPTLEAITLDQNSGVFKNEVLSDPATGHIFSPKKIVSDGDSVFWFTQKDILVKYGLNGQILEYYPKKNIQTLEILDSSTLLISIDKEGLWKFDKSTGTFFDQYTHEADNPSSLISNTIHYLSKDRDGGIWASSSGKGISFAYPDKNKFHLVQLASLRDATSLDLNGMNLDQNGNLFCSTKTNGMYTISPSGRIIREWNFTDEQSRLRLQSVFKIFTDNLQNKWISTFNGLSIITPNTEKIVHITDNSTVMWAPFQLSDNRILFSASQGGLYEAIPRDGGYDMRRIDSTQFPTEYLTIHEDKNGFIWIHKQLVKIFIVDPVSFKVLDSIPIEGIVNDIIEVDSSDIAWAAGSHGLFKISTEDYRIKSTYNKDRALNCTGISNMVIDNHGKLWLTCGNQIIKFDPSNEQAKTYDEHDGLPYAQITPAVSCKLPTGQLCFASNGSFVSFHPDQLQIKGLKAIPQITSLFINDVLPMSKVVCQATGATNISEIEKLKLSHRDNTISFIVNSLEYSAPENNKVRFILENVDRAWVEAPTGTLARYPNLRAGTFLFKVQAANSDGVYSDDIRELMITITPPFYKTWWFITLSALALLGLIIYIMYLNFSKKLELQKVRLRLYENLHDEVGSRLTSIVFMAEEVAQQNGQNPKLQQITKVAKSIVANMRRLVWATDPENDTMQSLVQKIRLDKSMILNDKIDFHLDLDPKLSDMNLQGEIRYQITSVINEALNNISKYAQAKNVFILLGMKDNDLHLRIRDDGIGFNPEETRVDKVKSSGYGLGNMDKRIARVKGTLTINSQPGKGTTIDARIPLS